MKKILIFIPSLAGGGAERTIINIMKYIDKNMFNVVLVMVNENIKNNNKHEYIDLVPEDIEIKYLNCKLSNYNVFKIISRLSKTIYNEKPDLIFSTTIKANIIAIVAKLICKVKIPIVVRESNNRTEAGITILGKLITSYLYKKSQHIISLSKGVKLDLVNNFKINKNNITVIYNPIDINEISKLSLETVDDILIDNSCKIIIASGRLVEQKDYPTLLKAFKQIQREINCKLLILGKGPKEEELKQLCKELNIHNDVVFLGFKYNPYKYMSISDLFILSSRWEGFGHVIVEAMAVGTPVIATNCKSGPSEIIKNEYFGKIVDVGDYDMIAKNAIEILTDRNMRQELSKKSLERSKDFDAQEIVKQYESVFLHIINCN